jgi:hypothetical protein
MTSLQKKYILPIEFSQIGCWKMQIYITSYVNAINVLVSYV